MGAMPLLALLAASALASERSCLPEFAYRGGWLGGDAAYSAALPDGRRLWLFGDTFVGSETAKTRSGAAMVANSVAVSTCGPGGFEVDYGWRRAADGKPAPFFDTGDPKVRYWPLDAFVQGGVAYVFLARIRTTGQGPLDFAGEGVDVARLSLGPGDPAAWSVRLSSLSADGRVQLGAAAALDGGWAYLFAPDMRPGRSHRAFLVRTPPSELDRGRTSLEYLAADGVWKPGLEPDDARAVLPEASSELSVRRHGKRWAAVFSAGGLPSPGVAVSTAASPAGPWSAPRLAFRYPETLMGSPGYDADTFCYAGKESAGLGAEGELVVTYACNSWRFEKLAARMDLYRPRAAVIPME